MIFEVIESHLLKLVPFEIVQKANPIEILDNWELKSKTKAKRALKIGLQDLISQIKEFPQDLRTSIDEELTAKKLPSLSELEGIKVKIIARILKRGQIKTLEEFYVVKEEVIDLSSNLEDTDRKVLDKIITEFELSKAKKNDD